MLQDFIRRVNTDPQLPWLAIDTDTQMGVKSAAEYWLNGCIEEHNLKDLTDPIKWAYIFNLNQLYTRLNTGELPSLGSTSSTLRGAFASLPNLPPGWWLSLSSSLRQPFDYGVLIV